MAIQVYAPTSNPEEGEFERLYEDLQDLPGLTPQKVVLFIIMDWNAKAGSQRDTWSNSQVWCWVQNEAGQSLTRGLPRECTGHSKHPLPTTQEKTLHMDITIWSIPK